MKKLFLVPIVAALCFASCKNEAKETMETDNSAAIDTTATVTDTTEMTEVPMDSVAMQKAWEEYATPGEPHKMMAAEEGSWTNEMTFWMEPNGTPVTATSTAEIKMIFDGRYQESNYKGNMMGMPFEGKATLAYDNASDEFVSTFIDNMGTGIMVMRGTYDQANKTITFIGTMTDPMSGKESETREVYTIVDENTRKMEMYNEARDGSGEYKSMEILMKRNM